MKPWIVDLLKGGAGLVVEGIRAAIDRRRRRKAKRRAKDILDDYQWRSTAASQRAHEAARRRGELDR